MWAMLAAPMLVSVDLRTIDPIVRDQIYFKRGVIEVSQDPLGIQARRVKGDNNYQVCFPNIFSNDLLKWLFSLQLWVKSLIGGDQAVAIMSTRTDGFPAPYVFSLTELNIENPADTYMLTDIFDDEEARPYSLTDLIHTVINPNGIRMFRAIPYKSFTVEENIFEINIL